MAKADLMANSAEHGRRTRDREAKGAAAANIKSSTHMRTYEGAIQHSNKPFPSLMQCSSSRYSLWNRIDRYECFESLKLLPMLPCLIQPTVKRPLDKTML